MNRVVVIGGLLLGLMATACGAPHDIGRAQDPAPAAGAGGQGGGAVAPPGSGGVAGTLPPLPTGDSGRAGVGGVGGGAPPPPPTRAGVYSEEVVEAEDAPPPIAGGTLAIVGQGHRAAVSDPDHDQVVIVDLDAMSIVSTIALRKGDEPGRLVADADGRLHVALRGGRGVAVLDAVGGTVLARLPVCVHPRGLAVEPARDAIHVACAGGELVTYRATTGDLLRKLRLERDLRDVVIDGERLLVSRFRAAEILVVEANGTVVGKLRPPLSDPARTRIPAVAWRTIPAPGGGAIMVYQLLRTALVSTTPGGYGGTCGGIISTAVSILRTDGASSTVEDVPAVLPVDEAATMTGHVAVISAAWTPGSVNSRLTPYSVITPPDPTPEGARVTLGCSVVGPDRLAFMSDVQPPGRVVAVGYYGPEQQIVLQTREPATLVVGDRIIPLPGASRKHTGHELFHFGTLGNLACASCHPEGHDDGQVWTFAVLGARRTQSISGGISGTEPFHWSGDMATFSALAHDVFNGRMTGPVLSESHIASLFRWIDKIPSMESPAAEDPAAAERGRALFNHPDVGCATCHAGEKFTNNATVNVGTGSAFQVPSLVGLAWRAPYMHTGCASTLAGRFTSCGGGDAHGHTSQLTDAERADLITYLDTL